MKFSLSSSRVVAAIFMAATIIHFYQLLYVSEVDNIQCGNLHFLSLDDLVEPHWNLCSPPAEEEVTVPRASLILSVWIEIRFAGSFPLVLLLRSIFISQICEILCRSGILRISSLKNLVHLVHKEKSTFIGSDTILAEQYASLQKEMSGTKYANFSKIRGPFVSPKSKGPKEYRHKNGGRREAASDDAEFVRDQSEEEEDEEEVESEHESNRQPDYASDEGDGGPEHEVEVEGEGEVEGQGEAEIESEGEPQDLDPSHERARAFWKSFSFFPICLLDVPHLTHSVEVCISHGTITSYHLSFDNFLRRLNTSRSIGEEKEEDQLLQSAPEIRDVFGDSDEEEQAEYEVQNQIEDENRSPMDEEGNYEKELRPEDMIPDEDAPYDSEEERIEAKIKEKPVGPPLELEVPLCPPPAESDKVYFSVLAISKSYSDLL
ncbi:protein LEO1 [Sesamum angolense]|uniref:Protein LEO1 n=1 Tax=Sesamum angolense TaxID=2727404 RepID=A0AAE2BSE9_9LAMI|nr:protein LEO1 [Sesamum angolense]